MNFKLVASSISARLSLMAKFIYTQLVEHLPCNEQVGVKSASFIQIRRIKMIKFIKRMWRKLFHAQKVDQRDNAFTLVRIEYDPINHTWTEWI